MNTAGGVSPGWKHLGESVRGSQRYYFWVYCRSGIGVININRLSGEAWLVDVCGEGGSGGRDGLGRANEANPGE